MSEAVSTSRPTVAGRRWLSTTTRVLVAVLILLAAVGFLVNIGGIVGVWVARAPARDSVTTVSAAMTRALGIADNGLARVSPLVQDARQTVALVNSAAALLGARVRANSPVITRLSQLVDNRLAPRIESMRAFSNAIHDAVVLVGGALLVLKHIPGVALPRLSSVLGSVSDLAHNAQTALQDLQTTLAGIKSGLVANAEAAVTQLTSRIDAALAQLQTTINKYKETVVNTQAWVTSTRSTVFTVIDVTAASLTLLFLIFAAGLVLLIYFCWRYVRTGHFPSLRVRITS